MISQSRLQEYRSQTFCYGKKFRITSKDQAIELVNRRGFIYFWPITGITLPSLWGAVAGDRPVPNEHDDPAHITWDWKDSLLGKHVWFYGKILRKKATMISMQVVPYFYALSENYGSPEADYLTMYEQGRMTQESKAIYEALLEKGPLDTVTLRKMAHLSSLGSEARFNKALTDLQADFKIMPVGITEAGAWHYSFAYELVSRYEPGVVESARFIGEIDAQVKILDLYFRSVGAARERDISKLFGWAPADIEQALSKLLASGAVIDQQEVEQETGHWWVITDLL